ncbi:hypothetical protein DFH29DRAFT_235730 [Suillus ampliporus]|nr:hypothetical protein DFH29DRAFT_235730 [Suillus ampliporus]
MMTFTPINRIHQHLSAFHVYAQDHTRHVEAHHFCSRRSKDFHQCVIYDFDAPDARLIGIEYIVSEQIFKSLPEEEKRYWHSHQYEVESGVLRLETKCVIPSVMNDTAEKPAMLELHQTYGKTIHTWAFDEFPDLPLGPPQLMMSYTRDNQANDEVIRRRDERSGVSTSAKRKLREGYLPPYQKDSKADQLGVIFKPEEVRIQK